MGPYSGVDYNSPNIIGSQLSTGNQLSTPTIQWERGGVGKISPIG
jgi:hypothetical protein